MIAFWTLRITVPRECRSLEIAAIRSHPCLCPRSSPATTWCFWGKPLKKAESKLQPAGARSVAHQTLAFRCLLVWMIWHWSLCLSFLFSCLTEGSSIDDGWIRSSISAVVAICWAWGDSCGGFIWSRLTMRIGRSQSGDVFSFSASNKKFWPIALRKKKKWF